MNERERHEIYFEMYKNTSVIEKKIRDSLRSWTIYNLEVYVGKEATREYQIYFEGVDKFHKYINIIGLYTLDDIYRLFNI